MTLEEIMQLKAEIISNLTDENPFLSALPQSFGVEFARLRRARHKKMLAVGYSKRDDGEYTLELRVKSLSGSAFDLAKRIKQEIGDGANISSLSRISTPAPHAAVENETTKLLRQRHSPLRLGSSIGNCEGKSGSVGGFLTDSDGEERYVLSCNHVLALCNRAPVSSDIYHPGPSDAAAARQYRIGELSEFVANLTKNTANTSDSACARLDPPNKVAISGNVIPAGQPGAGRYIAPLTSEAFEGTVVEKVGRSTGHTKGTVRGVSIAGVDVEYVVFQDGQPEYTKYIFDEVIEIRSEDGISPFSTYGDSGSLVYLQEGNKAYGLGLIFGGALSGDSSARNQFSVSLCCPLGDVLRKYPELQWMPEP